MGKMAELSQEIEGQYDGTEGIDLEKIMDKVTPLKDRFKFVEGDDDTEDMYELVEDDNIYIQVIECPIKERMGILPYSVNQWVRISKDNDFDGYNVFIQGCYSLNDAMYVANGLEKNKLDLRGRE